MTAQEAELHYPLDNALPAPGSVLEVAPGVKWVRMGLPFELNHINLWLLRDNAPHPTAAGEIVQGWCVVDCGLHTEDSKAHWESVFTHALDGLPIVRVLATHMHPDHIGLAHWLCERWQAPFWISATDFQVARLGCLGTTGFGGTRAADFYAAHGLNSAQDRTRILERTNYFPSLVPALPPQFHRLMDGTILNMGGNTWRAISGYGHAPEHMALYCEDLGILISGDMVLPRISTNISVYEQEPEANPLALFLDSIDKFLPLPPDTLVLPSHGKPFTGLHTRVAQLHTHHTERLDEVAAACRTKPCSAADILGVMFKRPLDMHQTTFAMGEAIAHLHALWYEGALRRTCEADGVYRFTTETL